MMLVTVTLDRDSYWYNSSYGGIGEDGTFEIEASTGLELLTVGKTS